MDSSAQEEDALPPIDLVLEGWSVNLDQGRAAFCGVTLIRGTRNILFDEKMGGTVHLALGASYPETGGINQSALHWDMICDLRKSGEVWVDDTLFLKDGKILV